MTFTFLDYFRKDLLPKYIQEKKHNDWIWGLRWVPRTWTSFAFPMPTFCIAGRPTLERVRVNPEYPTWDYLEYMVIPSPVPSIGNWEILGVKLFKNHGPIPCYFAVSWLIFGRRLHFNIGLKPDITDFHWGFPEASFTFKKINENM